MRNDKRTLTAKEKRLFWTMGIFILVVILVGSVYLVQFTPGNGSSSTSEEPASKPGETAVSETSTSEEKTSDKDHKQPKASSRTSEQSESKEEQQEQTDEKTDQQKTPSRSDQNGNESPDTVKSEQEESENQTRTIPEDASGTEQLKQSWHESIQERSGDIVNQPFQPDDSSLVSKSRIKVYRKSSAVIIPAYVTTRTSILEVFLCSEGGKAHESLFTTRATPKKTNLSLILANFQHEENPGETGPQHLGDPALPGGDPVTVLVEWKLESGNWIRYRGEDLVKNVAEEIVMRRVGFVFAGSRFIKKVGRKSGNKEIFAASRVKTLIALFHDPSAILDIPVPQGGTDSVFKPRTEVLPPVQTKVNIILRKPNDQEKNEMDRNIQESRKVWGPRTKEMKEKEPRRQSGVEDQK